MTVYKLLDEVKLRGFISVKPLTSVIDAVREMDEQENDALLVMESDELVGIVTTNDIAFRALMKGLPPETTPVKNIMTTPVHKLTVTPHTILEECLAKMSVYKVRHLPLEENGKIVGLVTSLQVGNYRYNDQIQRAMETGSAMGFAT